MKRRLYLVLSIILVSIMVLTGCSNSNTTTSQNKSIVEQLYEAKNPYVGKNSANIKLLDLLNISEFGKYTTELQTAKAPYSLTINFTNLKQGINIDQFNTSMEDNAIMLLSLIGNAEEINWTYTNDNGSVKRKLTLEDTSKIFNKNVKDFSKSQADLDSLNKILNK